MNSIVIHFGAGNIGRGFIGFLLSTAKQKVIFVDIDKTIVASLHREKQYQIQEVHSEQETTITVNNVDALLSTDEKVVDSIVDTSLITCSVGATILPHIAPVIVQGIIKRMQLGIHTPLHIIACENMIRASSALQEIIVAQSSQETKEYINRYVFFLDSAVDRIVPTMDTEQTQEAGLTTPVVRVEPFFEWCVESTNMKDNFPLIEGLHKVENLQPYIERKLFTLNTAHSYAAWLGHKHNVHTIYECMSTPSIVSHVKGICQETAAILIQKHGFLPDDHQTYIDSVLTRLGNPCIKDSVYRAGRSPLRKLSKNERIIKPLTLALEYNLAHQELLQAVVHALQFYHKDDQESITIQEQLNHLKPSQLLQEVSELNNTQVLSQIDSLYLQ